MASPAVTPVGPLKVKSERGPAGVGGKKRSLTKQRQRIGILATLPAFLVVAGLLFYPIGYAIWISFLKTDGVTSKFIGLKNYVDIFAAPLVHEVFFTNLKFLAAIPFVIFFGTLTAVLLYQEIYGWKLFRIIFFLPSVLSASVIGLMFRSAFTLEGPVNSALIRLGFTPINFFARANMAIFVVVMALIWSGFGYAMMILLSGLMAIDGDIFLAAEVDGAGWWQRFWYIIIPNVRNQLAFVSIINILYTFTSLFGYIFVMTAGGPLYSTTTLDYLIYQKAFSASDMGQGSALAVIVFGIISILTIAQSKYLRNNDGN
ncbi:MAG TPA: sugar ABC transporter permease [Candidatus Paceibacterota bacterium]|nr:sugar ABC transporter permease [Candidatus Paceibacterota bacterium]